MRTSRTFSVLMAILAMVLAMYAVPFPASLVFLVAIAGGTAIAFWQIRRSGGGPTAE
jgi:hypothetical protein